MLPSISIIIGKAVRAVSRLRGGGSALPGLVVEKIDPNFIQRTLTALPEGVVFGKWHKRENYHHKNAGRTP